MTQLCWLPTESSKRAEGFCARPFGVSGADLAVSFDAGAEAALTAVLAACLSDAGGREFTTAEIAGWAVKRRRQGLIAVCVASAGPWRELAARCSDPDCGEDLELQVDLRQFRMDWRAERIPVDLPDGNVVQLRPPTADDLTAWAAAQEPAPEALVARLLVAGPAPEAGWAAAAERALSQDDALAELELNTGCPECGRATSVALVLENFLMRELQAQRLRLLDEVHVIALAYHWTEEAIIALPEARRRHYLTRIDEAWSA